MVILSNYERLIRRKFVGNNFGRSFSHQDQVLKMPMEALRLDRKDHAFLKLDVVIPTENRLLLVKPRPHAVPDERGSIVNAVFFKLINDGSVDFASCRTRATAIDR